MWIFSEKTKTWVNLEQAQRIASDGKDGYLVVSNDGVKTPINKEAYDKAMQRVDPDWWEKHHANKDSLDVQKALKAIIKATGAKLEEKKEEE